MRVDAAARAYLRFTGGADEMPALPEGIKP